MINQRQSTYPSREPVQTNRATSPLDWWWDRGWEEYFTVVHWDQRNAGQTYTLSSAGDPATLTLERFQADAEKLVQWARKRFGKRKVFVLGHSWGSMLGLKLAAAYPEWLYAYIGMGQLEDRHFAAPTSIVRLASLIVPRGKNGCGGRGPEPGLDLNASSRWCR